MDPPLVLEIHQRHLPPLNMDHQDAASCERNPNRTPQMLQVNLHRIISHYYRVAPPLPLPHSVIEKLCMRMVWWYVQREQLYHKKCTRVYCLLLYTIGLWRAYGVPWE
mmetsp:Transcript_2500/g.9430  ORF Transcript_2500/g.9430 Transcript_2500/m.9430 type:complete len:108 (-) Transcript_2500:851-1174(-)